VTPRPDPREGALRASLEAAGQGHLVAALDRLGAPGEAERARLLAQLFALDFAALDEQRRSILATPAAPGRAEFATAEVFPREPEPARAALRRSALERGAEELRAGRVAWLLVAGGQASRLGLEAPKGTFPVGPVSGRSLFDLFARKLLAARARSGARIPWYVMTSEANDQATRAFFEANAHFGLEAGDVFFFRQGMLPALDPEGRVLLAAPDRIFLAPNGHGGVLSALAKSGALADAARRGVRSFSYFQVDNPLARPADPLFIGLHALLGAQMSSKVVKKRDAAEKVGVLGRVGGRLSCIEYSDLPRDLREARGTDGELLFGAGNVAMHVLDLAFVERLTGGALHLPWHLARKDVDALDEAGRPGRRPGIKFEAFVFDALGMAERSVTLEVDRASEFSPVKNARGEDSPASCRADLCRLHGSWVAAAGLPLPPPDAEGVRPVEIDPLLADDLDAFLARAPLAPRVLPRGHLYA
jgi:UDP-N-acetylglucosamine/UDP-N-acetylgalactosamine diphosphorylase